MKKLFILLFIVFGFNEYYIAQRDVKSEKIGTPWIGIQYGLNQPTHDLSTRFGLVNHLGVLAGYKTKQNWFFGLDNNFIFGNQIKENNLLDRLKDSYGNLTDVNGNIAIVPLFLRGFNVNLAIGKVFPVFGPNLNSGIFVHAGIGYMAYKIRIESNSQVIPQIELDYKKGYDRLTSGLNTHQFIGYSFMSNNGFINWFAGFYMQQGFTKNQRNIFFDQPNIPVSKSLRKDYSYGIKVGWYIPFYKRKPKEFYYN